MTDRPATGVPTENKSASAAAAPAPMACWMGRGARVLALTCLVLALGATAGLFAGEFRVTLCGTVGSSALWPLAAILALASRIRVAWSGGTIARSRPALGSLALSFLLLVFVATQIPSRFSGHRAADAGGATRPK
jgi:hypothetical protein